MARRMSMTSSDIRDYLMERTVISPEPLFEPTPCPTRRFSTSTSDIAQYLGLWCSEGWCPSTADVASYLLGESSPTNANTAKVVTDDEVAGSDSESTMSSNDSMDNILDAY